jgi:acid phosphatase type 7
VAASGSFAHQNECTLAYWHIPLFSSGGRANDNTKSLWEQLYKYDADLILEARDHIYERFAPQRADGIADPARGIRSFIIGTGGDDLTEIVNIAPNSEVRNASTFGVLMLTLHSDSYDWQFVSEIGKNFTDSGTGFCH